MGTPTRPRSPYHSPSRPTSSDSEERARITHTSLLLWHARQNDYAALKRLLKEDPSLVSAQDYDGRTALHVAAFYNCLDSARVLIERGAPVNAQDRWENSPLADAEGAGHQEMAKLLKANGGHALGNHGSHLEPKSVAPPLPQKCDWEIDRMEIDFSKSSIIGKGSFGEIRKAYWRGTPVAVKTILPSLSDDKLVMQDFRHEVELLVKLRHPNIVQFLGAVTTQKPLMLITEFLQGGDLRAFLKEKGPLQAHVAVTFGLDIARGMTYLHNGPNVIIHRDLKPRNVLLVDTSHLKVGDFGLSKLVKVTHLHEVYNLTGETGSYRYMAPEVFDHKKYDTKVDVFSFGMIMFEMFEGAPPLSGFEPYEAAKSIAKENRRPTFTAKTYPLGMKNLIRRCWDGNSHMRPSFIDILTELEEMKGDLRNHDSHIWPFLSV
eukprot:c18785_g1_i1 orf=458-1756(-)